MRAWCSLKVVRSSKLLLCQGLVLSPLCLENQLPQCSAGKGVIRAWDQVIWWVLFSDLAERRWRRLRCAGFTQVGHTLLFDIPSRLQQSRDSVFCSPEPVILHCLHNDAQEPYQTMPSGNGYQLAEFRLGLGITPGDIPTHTPGNLRRAQM